MYELVMSSVFEHWLHRLKDRKARVIISTRLKRLASGNPGDVKSIGGGNSEMRINYGPGYRLYYRQVGTKIILLLCGGDKSTQRQDIAQAQAIAARWRDAKG